MGKNLIVLSILLLCGAGCTPGYRVHINGYSELAEPLDGDASIYVTTDPNSPNPIFDKQISKSINALLSDYGYEPAESPEAADYTLGFEVSVDAQKVTGYAPTYHSHFGGFGRYSRGYGFGYSAYTPYYDTLYDQWLILRLLKAGPEGDEVVWVGEAMMRTDRAELRETVDYLLLGCLEYLGVDTGRKVTVLIKQDDPRVMSLAYD